MTGILNQINPMLDRLVETPLAIAIAESSWLFPAIETVHVVAIVLVVGSIGVLDLRLLGVAGLRYEVTRVARETLPWTWALFTLAAISGVLLFISNAPEYWSRAPFRWKFVLLILAGLNMAAFHLTAYRKIASWNNGAPPLAARISGGLSLSLWLSIVVLGRWVGFV